MNYLQTDKILPVRKLLPDVSVGDLVGRMEGFEVGDLVGLMEGFEVGLPE